MNQEFATDALCVNNKPFVAIGSEADDLTNDAVSRNLDRRKMAFSIEGGRKCI
jgi:hypothetical protein